MFALTMTSVLKILSCPFLTLLLQPSYYIRPYLVENLGSRLLSHRKAFEGQASAQVGDDWGILDVVSFVLFLRFMVGGAGIFRGYTYN